MTRALLGTLLAFALGCGEVTNIYQCAGDDGGPPPQDASPALDGAPGNDGAPPGDGPWGDAWPRQRDAWVPPDGPAVPPWGDASVSAAELAVCGEPHGPRRYMGSPAELGFFLVGRWINCGGGYSELGVPSGGGLEFDGSGTYWVLVPGPGGGLVRATGADASGSWETVMPTETSFHLPSDLWAGLFTFAEEEPRRVSFGGGFSDLNWFAADREDSVADVAGRCAAPVGPTHVLGAGEADTLPLGRWARCDGPAPATWPTDAVGMELAADGHLYVLRRSTLGTMLRGVGVPYDGNWSNDGLDNGFMWLGIMMATGGNGYRATFSDDPRGMTIKDPNSQTTRFVLLP